MSMVPDRSEREAHVHRLVVSVWSRGVAGSVVAATMVGVILAVGARAFLDIPNNEYVLGYVTIHGTLLVFLLITTWFAMRWLVGRRMRWFVEARQASEEELELFAAVPRLIASANIVAWTLAAAAHLTYLARVQHHQSFGWSVLKAVATWGFGYIAASALGFLLVERAFRPYLRLMLPEDVSDWPSSMGLGPRLLVAWFAVAGAPLLLIAFTWIGFTDRQNDLAASALRVTAILAAVVGLIVFVFAGRTITGPLRRLQHALRDVATGDLTTRVEVDEAGEIGHVQAGFNTMVDGLSALASDNEKLQTELRAQLLAVQESRSRIVEAADAERARIERNLHDGAQQRLLALAFALRSVQRTVDSAALDEALNELDAAMAELRELARGIHPAILDEEGLGPALGSLAERATVPTTVSAPLNGRLPSAVEVTAYFVVAESLANVAKYADASQARVEASVEQDTLRIEVSDDGKGGADPGAGTGLRGLADRVAALGGELSVATAPGEGTRILAVIPCA